MNTLIELFDEHSIRNILSTEVFKPKNLIYLCGKDIVEDNKRQDNIRNFLKGRGLSVNIVFWESSKYRVDDIVCQLNKILDKYEDCAIDISGGTDDMLFAAGQVSVKRDVSVFTYSRRLNFFYNVSNADFAENVKCEIKYSIDDFIKISGGKADTGRISLDSLNSHIGYIEDLFDIFLKYKRSWSNITSWIAQATKSSDLSCKNVSLFQKCLNGRKVSCPENALKDLQKAGLINNLRLDGTVSFDFPDDQIRFWLRDVGSALEVFTYKKAFDSGYFDDLKCSAITEWSDVDENGSVYNEIDLVAVKDLTPYFISCKATKINTYALNELVILRDRFGGIGAKACIISTEKCSVATRERASALDITVYDIDDIKKYYR